MGERVTVYEINDEGWAWGQLAADGYVGWLPANALLAPRRRADAQGRGAAHARVSRARRSSCRRSRRCRSARGSRSRASEERFAVTATGGYRAGAASRAARSSRDAISSRSRSASSARRICGAARPASASTARAWCRSRSTACGIACPRDSDMQEQALGARVGPQRLSQTSARRSRVLEGPCRDRARRSDARARQCVSHGGRDRADCAQARRAHPRGRQRGDQRARRLLIAAPCGRPRSPAARRARSARSARPRRARSRPDRCRPRCAARASPSDASRTGCPAGSGSVAKHVERRGQQACRRRAPRGCRPRPAARRGPH